MFTNTFVVDGYALIIIYLKVIFFKAHSNIVGLSYYFIPLLIKSASYF